MADTSNLTNFLGDIADAIRTKKETTEQIPAEQFDQEILSIETGIDTSDATATADNLEIDKTAYVNNTKITGTLGKLMAINRTARDVATVNENLNMTALIRNLNAAYFPTVGQLDNNAYQMIFSIDGAYYMVTSSKQCNYQDYSSYEVLWNGGSLKAYKLINGTWVQSSIPNITFERSNSVVRIDNVRFVSIIAGSNYSIMYTENLSSVFYSQNTDLQPKNSIVTPDTALSISATNSDVANTIGLTADKLVKGNTVLGIEGTAETGVDTSDATATVEDIRKDKTAYVNGVKLIGNTIFAGVYKSFDELPNTSYYYDTFAIIDPTEKDYPTKPGNYSDYSIFYYGGHTYLMQFNASEPHKLYIELGQYTWSTINWGPRKTIYYWKLNTTTNSWDSYSSGDDVGQMLVQTPMEQYIESTYQLIKIDNDDETKPILRDVVEKQLILPELWYNNVGTWVRKLVNTAGGNRDASKLLTGYTMYAHNEAITGTMPNNGELTYAPSTEEQTIPAGYTSGGTIAAYPLTEDEYNTCLNLTNQILGN